MELLPGGGWGQEAWGIPERKPKIVRLLNEVLTIPLEWKEDLTLYRFNLGRCFDCHFFEIFQEGMLPKKDAAIQCNSGKMRFSQVNGPNNLGLCQDVVLMFLAQRRATLCCLNMFKPFKTCQLVFLNQNH